MKNLTITFILPFLFSFCAYSQEFNNYDENPFGLSDVGDRSNTCFVDIDNDGDFDMFSGEAYGSFYFFENTGTQSNPNFSSSSQNPFGLSDVGDRSNTCFVDIDNDGDFDMFSGEAYGSFYFFENTGTQSNPNFSSSSQNPFGLSDVGDRSNTCFVDIDNDGDFDMFSGEAYGSFYFFENTGTQSNPNFSSSSQNPFGLSDVGDRSNTCFVDIDNDGDFDMFSGEAYGSFYFFENTGTQSNPNFSSSSQNPFGLSDVGDRSNTCFVDIDNDGDFDMFSGEAYGSFYFFENTSSSGIENYNKKLICLFPNPTNGIIRIETIEQIERIKILDISGKEITNTTNMIIDLSTQKKGIYFIFIKTTTSIMTEKVVIN